MNNKIAIGGGSGAVVTSAHAGCERFRGTDPLITGQTRRNLAKALGAKDTVGSISEARWTRAKTFETLVHDPEFAGRIVSTALGGAGLPKPENVQVFKAGEDSAVTLDFLEKAIKAAKKGTATLIQAPAVPPQVSPQANPRLSSRISSSLRRTLSTPVNSGSSSVMQKTTSATDPRSMTRAC